MPLPHDRTGRIHGPLVLQQDFDLPGDGEVFLGGLYRVVNGMLVVPAEEQAQDQCITVMALAYGNNKGGQDRAKRVRCMVDGIALMPLGALTAANIGKPIYPDSDDMVTVSAPSVAGNLPAGVLLAVDRSHAKVKLG